MAAPQHRICQLADEAAAAREPEAALEKLRELRDELVAFERARVSQALRTGSSFGSVAKAMGISRQAAHRRYRDLAPGTAEPLALSSHARRAIQLARDEAATTGARTVASEHLLIGVLRSGGSASVALEAGGVNAEAARRCIRRVNGTRNGDGERAEENGAVRAVLAEAAKIARERGSRYVEADDLALAALDGPDDGARRAITALGLKPRAVRERLG